MLINDLHLINRNDKLPDATRNRKQRFVLGQGMANKKNVLWLALFCGIIFAQGCSTAQGIGKDTASFMDRLRQADEWVTKNLW